MGLSRCSPGWRLLGWAPSREQRRASYQFLINSNDGKALTRTNPSAPAVGSDPGGREPLGVLVDPGSYTWSATAYVPPPTSKAVIYELHVATFNDPTGMGKGTFQSVAAKLSDLAQLGVNMIELMPVADSPGAYSWGYNPDYPMAVAGDYGTPG